MGGSASGGGTGITVGSRTQSSFGRMKNRQGGFRTNVERARSNYRAMDRRIAAAGGNPREARANRRRTRPKNR